MEKPNPANFGGLFNVAYVLALAIALALLGVGLSIAAHGQGHALLAGGVGSLVIVLVTWPLAISLMRTRRATESERGMLTKTVTDRLQEISTLLQLMSEQQLLSDRAKAVAYRGNDREALRRAIREEMNDKDWDAALVLANEMETQFGYTQEAAALRTEINNNRTEVIGRQITETVNLIDQHTRAERWNQALREADQLLHIYPNNEQVKRLPQEIENRRQGHKKQLLDSWKEAVARKDVDGSIEILKKLDLYLTPVEAEAMQETARGIFKEKLNNLKDQFSKSVHEENWNEAIRIGDTIMHDFPNSRIALEVKDTMEALRQRAGGQAEVAGV
jgi:tetratricopeptide (TPR) repeat protein